MVAISLAQENQLRLVLLHILQAPKLGRPASLKSLSVAEVMHRLVGLVPQEEDLWYRPEPTLEHGEAGTEILAATNRCNAYLIVVGVRNIEALKDPAARAKPPIAYDVAAHARCPVLTVRG